MKGVSHQIVFTIEEWYDGALAGLANFNGHPHYYKSYWQDFTSDEWIAHYWLTPLDPEAFELALEEWAMWERWQVAFGEGATAEETHPTLPEDQLRHAEITRLLQEKLANTYGLRFKAKGVFHYGPEVFVDWALLD